jgi:hypothetical protein
LHREEIYTTVSKTDISDSMTYLGTPIVSGTTYDIKVIVPGTKDKKVPFCNYLNLEKL